MISPCILLIADNVRLLIKLEAELKRAGYRVLTAHDGSQAIYLAQAALVAVIVCDVTRRSRNDSHVKRRLAQDSQTASIPFVSLTKPFDKQELVARVNEVIRSQASGQEQSGRACRRDSPLHVICHAIQKSGWS